MNLEREAFTMQNVNTYTVEIRAKIRQIRTSRAVFTFAVLTLVVGLLPMYFTYSAVTTDEYFSNSLVARNFGIIRFLAFVVIIGACLFIWRNGENQFWYGIVEIFCSILYTFYYLDSDAFLPFINWLTALFFTVRGIQNCSDGVVKKFRYKKMILKLMIWINKGTEWAFEHIKKLVNIFS